MTIERIYIELARLTYVASETCAASCPRDVQNAGRGASRTRSIVRWLVSKNTSRAVSSTVPRQPMAEAASDVDITAFKILDDRRTELAVLTRPEAQAARDKTFSAGFLVGASSSCAPCSSEVPTTLPLRSERHPSRTIASRLFPLDPDELKYATKVGLAIALRLRGRTDDSARRSHSP